MTSLSSDTRHLAESYDALTDSQFDTGVQLIQALGVKPGDTVLDVGCGTGELGFHVTGIIGPSGRLIGIDPSEDRIAVARRRNTHGNAEFRLGVGEDLGFIASRSVDVVYLSAVFDWITDHRQASREIWRVLKPGGRVGLTTIATELVGETTLGAVTASVLGQPRYRGGSAGGPSRPPVRHGVTVTGVMEILLEAGLDVSDAHVRAFRRPFRSGKDIVKFAESSKLGTELLLQVPEELRDQARAELEREFERQRTERGIELRLYTTFALAEKVAFSDRTGSRARLSLGREDDLIA